jgi:predicted AAA+ superfamily ATPase
MDILEILYTREFKKATYHVRKLSIDTKKLLLLGPRGSGKSTLIFDYLSHLSKGSFLYIDFDDFRVREKIKREDIENFIKKNSISVLVLEHFDFSFSVPACQEVIITTSEKKTLEGFETKTLYPLDFEEFISFDKRELNLEAIFNSYASSGTFPSMVGLSRAEFAKEYQEYLKRFADTHLQMQILALLASRQATTISIHALFQELKLTSKVSKDTFYAYVQKLQDEKVIFLIDKHGQKKGAKKLYLIDFAIRSALSFEKDFIKRFENIIFLELLKRGYKLGFTEIFDFYIEDESKVILSIPFLPINLIETKLERFRGHFENFGIKTVQVVTMELEKVYEQDGITFELIPFVSFATL